jgi:alanine dehydrogenase
MNTIGIIITIVSLGIGAMALLMVGKWVKNDYEIKKLKAQKEAADKEIEQMDTKIKLLEEENKKYDRIINGQ